MEHFSRPNPNTPSPPMPPTADPPFKSMGSRMQLRTQGGPPQIRKEPFIPAAIGNLTAGMKCKRLPPPCIVKKG
jgi:hypothetical protein